MSGSAIDMAATDGVHAHFVASEGLRSLLVESVDVLRSSASMLDKRRRRQATFGFLAPFIGMIGAVWGILHSSQSIAASKEWDAAEWRAANRYYACLRQSARRAAYDPAISEHGRVGFRVVFGRTGALTAFSIVSSSGNSTLDAIAAVIVTRCGANLRSIGRPFSINGGVVF